MTPLLITWRVPTLTPDQALAAIRDDEPPAPIIEQFRHDEPAPGECGSDTLLVCESPVHNHERARCEAARFLGRLLLAQIDAALEVRP